jgi:hypothetical protein
MKQDMDWNTVSTSYNPLTSYLLIKRPFSTLYDQELPFYSFKQDSLSNPQWYEQFNTKVDVGEAMGVTRQHKVLLEYVAE